MWFVFVSNEGSVGDGDPDREEALSGDLGVVVLVFGYLLHLSFNFFMIIIAVHSEKMGDKYETSQSCTDDKEYSIHPYIV